MRVHHRFSLRTDGNTRQEGIMGKHGDTRLPSAVVNTRRAVAVVPLSSDEAKRSLSVANTPILNRRRLRPIVGNREGGREGRRREAEEE